ncbi:hypothetical protein HVPorG_04925 [Roseomonas mucosa]|nr:hypothetical protein HVPorG_04925 [Roseomonas mucosa]
MRRFDPRSRTGSDNIPAVIQSSRTAFRSTLPHGERLPPDKQIRVLGEFRSTLPHGERRPTVGHGATIAGFDPRSRTGSDQFPVALMPFHAPFRSTLPHGERQHPGRDPVLTDRVSIHAPARGATGVPDLVLNAGRVSIHAPARGATSRSGG